MLLTYIFTIISCSYGLSELNSIKKTALFEHVMPTALLNSHHQWLSTQDLYKTEPINGWQRKGGAQMPLTLTNNVWELKFASGEGYNHFFNCSRSCKEHLTMLLYCSLVHKARLEWDCFFGLSLVPNLPWIGIFLASLGNFQSREFV